MDSFMARLTMVPTAAEIHAWDQKATEFGIPEEWLMENAGRAFCQFAMEYYGSLTGKPVALFMGSGNNGGDAACMARHLKDAGACPAVFHSKPLEQYDGSTGLHVNLARKNEVSFIPLSLFSISGFISVFLENFSALPALLVDGILGTGFTRQLREETRLLIEMINELGRVLECPVLALDIPSGLNADTGAPSPVAIRASQTVTLAAPKRGLLLPAAKKWTGKTYLRQIGFPAAITRDLDASALLLDASCIPAELPFPSNSYKNVYGHLLVIGGCPGYEGAAHIACVAALRMGVGLVTACAPEKSLAHVKDGWPEIMTLNAGSTDIWPANIPRNLENMLDSASAIVIGPGMGRTPQAASFLQAVLGHPSRPPAVIDADALVLLGARQDVLATLKDRDILTPHPGEASALLQMKTIRGIDRFTALENLTNISPAVTVLKGAGTLVGQRNMPVLVSPYDIPQLAIGGAGDALAGCAGAIMASGIFENLSSHSKAGLAVAMHALAGIICSLRFPDRGLRASRLADTLPEVPGYVRKMGQNIIGEMPWPALN